MYTQKLVTREYSCTVSIMPNENTILEKTSQFRHLQLCAHCGGRKTVLTRKMSKIHGKR